MDNILFLIVWGLFIFVLPNIFGKKNKKDKPYEQPLANMGVTGTKAEANRSTGKRRNKSCF